MRYSCLLYKFSVPISACSLYFFNPPVLAVEHIEARTKWDTFSEDIFKFISLNKNVCIIIEFLLTIDSKSALVKVLAWQQSGDKPLH